MYLPFLSVCLFPQLAFLQCFVVSLLLPLAYFSEYRLALSDALVLPADFPFLSELLSTAEQNVYIAEIPNMTFLNVAHTELRVVRQGI